MIKVLSTALIFSMLMLFVQVYFTKLAKDEVKEYKQKYETAKHTSDSLYADLYPCEIELNRIKTAEYILLKRNPAAYKQLADIISNETE